MRSKNRRPSALNERGFAHIRKPECEALRSCKPSAAAALIYIRSELATNENKPFACGSRDFAAIGLGRDAAASALSELECAKILRRLEDGSFRRGKKAVFQLTNTRAGVENRVGKPANPETPSAGKTAKFGRKTRQLRQNTAGYSDTLKETSSTSSQKSKEEEVTRVRDSAPMAAVGKIATGEADDDGPEARARRAANREELRKMMQVIDEVALPRHLSTKEFIDAFGGDQEPLQDCLRAAYALCLKFLRGEISEPELMSQRAERPLGSAGKEFPQPSRLLIKNDLYRKSRGE